MLQFDLLIAAKFIHLVSDVVFEALDVLLVGTSVEKIESTFNNHYVAFVYSL